MAAITRATTALLHNTAARAAQHKLTPARAAAVSRSLQQLEKALRERRDVLDHVKLQSVAQLGAAAGKMLGAGAGNAGIVMAARGLLSRCIRVIMSQGQLVPEMIPAIALPMCAGIAHAGPAAAMSVPAIVSFLEYTQDALAAALLAQHGAHAAPWHWYDMAQVYGAYAYGSVRAAQLSHMCEEVADLLAATAHAAPAALLPHVLRAFAHRRHPAACEIELLRELLEAAPMSLRGAKSEDLARMLPGLAMHGGDDVAHRALLQHVVGRARESIQHGALSLPAQAAAAHGTALAGRWTERAHALMHAVASSVASSPVALDANDVATLSAALAAWQWTGAGGEQVDVVLQHLLGDAASRCGALLPADLAALARGIQGVLLQPVPVPRDATVLPSTAGCHSMPAAPEAAKTLQCAAEEAGSALLAFASSAHAVHATSSLLRKSAALAEACWRTAALLNMPDEALAPGALSAWLQAAEQYAVRKHRRRLVGREVLAAGAAWSPALSASSGSSSAGAELPGSWSDVTRATSQQAVAPGQPAWPGEWLDSAGQLDPGAVPWPGADAEFAGAHAIERKLRSISSLLREALPSLQFGVLVPGAGVVAMHAVPEHRLAIEVVLPMDVAAPSTRHAALLARAAACPVAAAALRDEPALNHSMEAATRIALLRAAGWRVALVPLWQEDVPAAVRQVVAACQQP